MGGAAAVLLHLAGASQLIAGIRDQAFKTKGVWIVPHHELLERLRAQRNQTVPFERLARYADRV
jgi:hypothetical protein